MNKILFPLFMETKSNNNPQFHNPNPPDNTTGDNHNPGMETFKEALVQFAHSNPNLFPNDASNFYPKLIEQRFSQFFPDFQTPNHPPYAAMIHRAIWELNKKGGSSEKLISKYIKKEYADLPWAHSTLLKHHLEKLCDRNEICMNHKQRYLLAGADSESGKKSSGSRKRKQHSESEKKSSGFPKKCKKQKSRPDSEPGKLKKYTKKKKCQLDIGETDDKGQIGIRRRKRKQRLKSKKKSSKWIKKHEINEESQPQVLTEANLKQHNEIKTSDIQIQEQNEVYNDGEMGQESHPDNSGNINSEQTERKQNPQLLQPEETPDSNQLLKKNGKRVWTRSQLNTILKKGTVTESPGNENMPKDNPDIVDHLSDEKQQAMGIIKVKKATQMNGQRAKLRSSQKNQIPDVDETTELLEVGNCQKDQRPEKTKGQLEEDKPKYKGHGKSPKKSSQKNQIPDVDETTELLEVGNCQKDQRPEKSKGQLEEDKPKYKGHGKSPKKSQPSAEKCKVRGTRSKSKRVDNEVSAKSTNKKYKNQGKHKMTRRSSRKKKVASC